jgi:hypothetical protein
LKLYYGVSFSSSLCCHGQAIPEAIAIIFLTTTQSQRQLTKIKIL